MCAHARIRRVFAARSRHHIARWRALPLTVEEQCVSIDTSYNGVASARISRAKRLSVAHGTAGSFAIMLSKEHDNSEIQTTTHFVTVRTQIGSIVATICLALRVSDNTHTRVHTHIQDILD
jgi:hypothetical protein